MDFMVDVRRYWVMQHLDAPKCMYDFCFKEKTREEKKWYYDQIRSLIGHYPDSVCRDGKLQLD